MTIGNKKTLHTNLLRNFEVVNSIADEQDFTWFVVVVVNNPAGEFVFAVGFDIIGAVNVFEEMFEFKGLN